jgi:hypothetical protein
MWSRCFGILAALTLLIGAPAERVVGPHISAVAPAVAVQGPLGVKATSSREHPQAALLPRIDGDDTPDPPPLNAGAVTDQPEQAAGHVARPLAAPACRPAVRATRARGPPVV